jgi:hypothetical protein
MDMPPSPFETATIELRALGITLARLPGEYEVNFRGGRDETAQRAETLAQALQLGRTMAADRLPPSTPDRRRRRPPRMTAKAVNRRRRRAHWRRMVAQARRDQKDKR